MKKEPALETKKLKPKKEQLQEIPSDPEHLPLSPFSSSRVEEPTCSLFPDVSPLLSSEIGNVDFDISETQESKIAEEPLSISTTPLHEPTTITSNPSSSNEHQHQVISCPRLSWICVKKVPKEAFDFIINRLKPKHGKIQYFKGNEMETKRYQFSSSKPLCLKKPGPKQQLGLDDEVFLVLMRIRLDSPIEDLAFRFIISAGYASKISQFFSQRIKTIDLLANT